MKILKLGVLICGALGLAGLLMSGIGAMLELNKIYTIVMLVAFGLPVVMGLMGIAKPPFQAWQAGVSLACFALAAYKLTIWESIRFIFKDEVPTDLRLILIGTGLGVLVSVIAVLKPEDAV